MIEDFGRATELGNVIVLVDFDTKRSTACRTPDGTRSTSKSSIAIKFFDNGSRSADNAGYVGVAATKLVTLGKVVGTSWDTSSSIPSSRKLVVAVVVGEAANRFMAPVEADGTSFSTKSRIPSSNRPGDAVLVGVTAKIFVALVEVDDSSLSTKANIPFSRRSSVTVLDGVAATRLVKVGTVVGTAFATRSSTPSTTDNGSRRALLAFGSAAEKASSTMAVGVALDCEAVWSRWYLP